MAEIILDTAPVTDVFLGKLTYGCHEKLKHLDFESSGHRGFQKQLTEKQLANIDALDAIGDFELIDSVTLEENVISVTPEITEKYKELFILFKIPKSPSVGGTKGRWMVYTKSGTGLLKYCIYNQGNWLISEYTTTAWRTAFHFKVFGSLCMTDMWFNNSGQIDGGYAMGYNAATLNGSTAPAVKLFNEYIDALKIDFISPNGTADENMRYLPAGTSYELWGVKA